MKEKPNEFLKVFPDFKGNLKDSYECIEHIKNTLINGLSKERNIKNINFISVIATNRNSVIELFDEFRKMIEPLISPENN